MPCLQTGPMPLIMLPIIEIHFEWVSMDILVLVDYVTGYPEATPI